MSDQEDLEAVEIALLMEGIYRWYGFDFRNYAPASLKRRLWRRAIAEGVPTISALQDRVLHDPKVMEQLLLDLSISVTAMYRDPGFYVAFRQKVVPLLRTYPFVRIWNAGCATGEEVVSLAILLAEEGIHDKTRIYATDFNDGVLARARSGAFPLDRMRDYTQNYISAGGKRSFSEYYVANADSAEFDRSLIDNVVFAQHNLVSDRSFNEFHVIVCRNVMIYFDKALRERVHGLFYESLVKLGILGLGRRETARFTSYEDRYEPIDEHERIYRKVA